MTPRCSRDYGHEQSTNLAHAAASRTRLQPGGVVGVPWSQCWCAKLQRTLGGKGLTASRGTWERDRGCEVTGKVAGFWSYSLTNQLHCDVNWRFNDSTKSSDDGNLLHGARCSISLLGIRYKTSQGHSDVSFYPEVTTVAGVSNARLSGIFLSHVFPRLYPFRTVTLWYILLKKMWIDQRWYV